MIAAFLHAARIGLFEMSWNVLCPGCGGVLDANATLKTCDREEYDCALCAAGYEPTLDEMVEVTLHREPARAPDRGARPRRRCRLGLSAGRSSGAPASTCPTRFRSGCSTRSRSTPSSCRRASKAILSLQLPAEFVIVFEPVTHSAQFLDVKGEPTRERQSLVAGARRRARARPARSSCGPGRCASRSRTAPARRVLPAVWIAGDTLHDLLGRRRPFLTAKRLLSNQTFRDIYRTDTLDVDQRLKITSLTFLFTDLKGSTELYERVGDLVAFDLVREHFRVLHEIVAAEAGAVVKTIGDAVMATFPTPDRALAAALRMREAMRGLQRGARPRGPAAQDRHPRGPVPRGDAQRPAGLFRPDREHRRACQGLAVSQSILATAPVIDHPAVRRPAQPRPEAAGAKPRAARCRVGSRDLRNPLTRRDSQTAPPNTNATAKAAAEGSQMSTNDTMRARMGLARIVDHGHALALHERSIAAAPRRTGAARRDRSAHVVLPAPRLSVQRRAGEVHRRPRAPLRRRTESRRATAAIDAPRYDAGADRETPQHPALQRPADRRAQRHGRPSRTGRLRGRQEDGAREHHRNGRGLTPNRTLPIS